LAPAPSTEKSAPHGSNPALAGPDPQAMEALCLYAESLSKASNHPSLKGYRTPYFLIDLTGSFCYFRFVVILPGLE